MKRKCLIISLSVLSLTLLLSLLHFHPTAPPSSSPSFTRLRRRRSTATHLPLTASHHSSLSLLFSPDHTLNDPSRLVWTHMRDLLSRPDTLPTISEATREAAIAFKSLLKSLSEQKDLKLRNENSETEKCPLIVRGNGSEIEIPCGLVEDSAVTIIGIPVGRNRSFGFGIEVIGSHLGGETNAKRPIVLAWNVSLDSNGSMIYQNHFSPENGWGELESCPGTNSSDKVDGLVQCNEQQTAERRAHITAGVPFVESHPFVATLWTGTEGFHMNVNGKHETSYRYKERLEPWTVTKIQITGDINLLSTLANNLPVSSDSSSETPLDLNQLKPPKNISKKEISLLVGVFSTASNFKRRMAIRRSWMQFEDVRGGKVVVRFFTGLHTNEQVNLELWREAELYQDIQILPFVDYYSLITLKTVAICIFATKILPAKYIMKMDDDAFIRVDEILNALNKTNSKGLLYGHISFQSSPHRDRYSKWFISSEEWANESYPPWAHGPGYIISYDIAEFIVQGHEERYLQLFKLEDVAMGIWIEEYKNTGREVNYVSDDNFHIDGCEAEYILAHYQSPRLLLCLWAKLQSEQRPFCCE
ncbi:hypothetical protein LUZ60_011543 [Juncus effusus]|nr:hypothetical protein LUZ60_011543 [Juncus effusus]